jgi:hypothetical protein
MSRVRKTINIPKVKTATKDAARRGLGLGGEHILGESSKEVPHEEGTLERSGAVTMHPTELEVAVSYDTRYAVRQHEDLTLKHDAGRKAKYLEDPLQREAGAALDIVGAEIRRALS